MSSASSEEAPKGGGYAAAAPPAVGGSETPANKDVIAFEAPVTYDDRHKGMSMKARRA